MKPLWKAVAAGVVCIGLAGCSTHDTAKVERQTRDYYNAMSVSRGWKTHVTGVALTIVDAPGVYTAVVTFSDKRSINVSIFDDPKQDSPHFIEQY